MRSINKDPSKNKVNFKKNESSSIHIFAYKLLNDRIQFLFPRLTGLEKSLKEAMIPIPFDVYVCSMVFFSLISAMVGGIIGVIVAIFVNIQPASFAVLLPILSGAGLGQITFFFYYRLSQKSM